MAPHRNRAYHQQRSDRWAHANGCWRSHAPAGQLRPTAAIPSSGHQQQRAQCLGVVVNCLWRSAQASVRLSICAFRSRHIAHGQDLPFGRSVRMPRLEVSASIPNQHLTPTRSHPTVMHSRSSCDASVPERLLELAPLITAVRNRNPSDCDYRVGSLLYRIRCTCVLRGQHKSIGLLPRRRLRGRRGELGLRLQADRGRSLDIGSVGRNGHGPRKAAIAGGSSSPSPSSRLPGSGVSAQTGASGLEEASQCP